MWLAGPKLAQWGGRDPEASEGRWSFTVGGAPEAAGTSPVASNHHSAGGSSASGVAGWGLGLLVTTLLWARRRRSFRAHTASAVLRPRLTLLLAALLVLTGAGVASGQATGTVVEYYHLDALGSVRAVTFSDNRAPRYHDYTPFGEEINVTFPKPDRKLFTGQERDSETALDYFGARYYRADLGRFTTVARSN